MKRIAISILGVMALVGMVAAPAYATNYLGPSFTVTSTSPGGPVYLTVTAASSTTFVAPPTGSGSQCQAQQTCAFPLQSCPDTSGFYYSIHQITMTDAQGNGYMVGSAVTSGMGFPFLLGGPSSAGHSTQTTTNGFADALNVTLGDNFKLTFGTAAVIAPFVSILPNPPNNHASAGPYYWWTIAPNVNGNNLRLDQHPSINPTTTAGVWVADIEGVVVCGNNVFFDQGVKIFFDSPQQFTVPQFPISAIGIVAIGFATVALLKTKKSVSV